MDKKTADANSGNRRRINRINQFHSEEFSVIVLEAQKKFRARVMDFNFDGIRVEYSEEMAKDFEPRRLEIYYGKKLISEVEQPQVVRVDGRTMAMKFGNHTTGSQRKTHRHIVKRDFRPSVMAPDPIRIKSNLHFFVDNFSSGGMLLQTSLSNKHLLQGMKILGATIMLPGLTMIKADLLVRFFDCRDNRLLVGTEFLNIEKEALEELAKFAIFGTEHEGNDLYKKFELVSSNFGRIRKLGGALRIENLTQPYDFDAVLNIRYLAYRGVGIIDPGTRIEDMTDEFDKRSIISVAKIGGAVIGAVRAIQCVSAEDEFMFESDIPFTRLKGVSRRSDYFEISRLAIDPNFQNTDIVLRLFEEAARQSVMNNKSALCLARSAQQKSYSRIGFVPVSEEIPHPMLADQTLVVMEIDKNNFIRGSKMSALSWMLVAKDVATNLAFAGIVKPPRFMLFRALRARIEAVLIKVLKKKNSTRVEANERANSR